MLLISVATLKFKLQIVLQAYTVKSEIHQPNKRDATIKQKLFFVDNAPLEIEWKPKPPFAFSCARCAIGIAFPDA